jgi:hypothetical protein
MPSKKRVHFQQFSIIHLPNPDLTYIRKPKRNKIMFISFHLLETYIINPSLFFNCFFTLPPRGKHRWQPRSARAYMRVGRWVLPSFYFCQVGLPNCWSPIFLVLPKLDIYQVDLPNRWSCSNNLWPYLFPLIPRSWWPNADNPVERRVVDACLLNAAATKRSHRNFAQRATGGHGNKQGL